MTSPYVTGPHVADRSAPWRVVLVVVTCVLMPPVAAVVALGAVVVWTGCFIECSDPAGDPVAGAGLALLAVSLLIAGPALAWLLLRTARAVALAVGGVLATVLAGLLLLGVH